MELEDLVSVDWLTHSNDLTDVWVRITPRASCEALELSEAPVVRAGNSSLASHTFRFEYAESKNEGVRDISGLAPGINSRQANIRNRIS